jgi:hypothetical protein
LEGHGFVRPTASQRRNLAEAYGAAGKRIEGRGFDVVERRTADLLDDPAQLRASLDRVVLYEVKTAGAQRKTPLGRNFGGLGFTMTEKEKQNAVALGKDHFRFIFVDLKERKFGVYCLDDFFRKDVAQIHPTYSIFIRRQGLRQ